MTSYPNFRRLLTVSMIAFSCLAVPAQAQSDHALLGGPTGVVKSDRNEPLEGMMVQLIAKKSGIRTTVYSHKNGHYEFPKIESGDYVLRIALPREYLPYVKEQVAIGGATHLDDIVLTHVTVTTVLPPTAQGVVAKQVSEPALLPQSAWMASQITGAEWLMSLPGSAKVKHYVTHYCNWCHSYQQIFRNRFDEDGWRKVIYRMTHGAGSPLININSKGRLPPDQEAELVHWLATVRGPNSPDLPFFTFPRPKGESTEAIITEYALPRLEIATHDVAIDKNRNLWYSTHRSSWFGRVNPQTGKVTQFQIPAQPTGIAPGIHWIHPDPNGIVWASENWAHSVISLNPKTGMFTRVAWPTSAKLNSPGNGNLVMGPNGNIWNCRDGSVREVDPKTGKIIKEWPTMLYRSTYGSAMSDDGRYFGGGAWPNDGQVILDFKTGQIWETHSSPDSGPARGNFDREDNFWSGGRGGELVEFDTHTHATHEYKMPIPYGAYYTAGIDKNDNVWAGGRQTGRYMRFNIKTEEYTQFMLPEPYGHDRKPAIDNATVPASVWYVDQEGFMVHIQPLH